MKCRGFSLAEILITLVILAFVGALGVPMIGQQKLKKPMQVIARHGTMECFYDTSGVLHQYRANNTENKNGIDEAPAESDACYFSAPSANAFVIQAVGAGGDGAVGSGVPGYTSKPFPINMSISTGTDYHAQISDKKVPDWVKKHWDKQWASEENWIKYKLTSPVGSSGKAECVSRRDETKTLNDFKCIDICTVHVLENCPKECRIDAWSPGGDSGMGGEYSIIATLGLDDNVEMTFNDEESTLTIGGNTITLQRSEDGKDGKVPANASGANPKVPEADGKGYDKFDIKGIQKFVSYSGAGLKIKDKRASRGPQPGGISCDKIQGKPAMPGKVEAVTKQIQIRGATLGVLATYGVAGGAGDAKMKILEKTPENTRFKLVPAKDTSKSSHVYIYTNGEWKELMRVSSGSTGYMTNNQHLKIEEGDLPFPRSLYPHAFEGQEPALVISTGAGYKSRIARMANKPGSSGAGAYPIITNVTGDPELWIQNVKIGGEPLKPLEGGAAGVTCLNGNSSGGYCGSTNTKGNPGAVVISW